MKKSTFIWPLILTALLMLAIIPGSASDYTLEIYGNANMDNTIDEKDVAYAEGIIAGTNQETKLADANYDGKIDKDDISQIKSIISGEDEEITIIDDANRTVTINKPVQSIVTLSTHHTEGVVVVGAIDRIVGVSPYEKTYGYYFPELADETVVGLYTSPDYEKIIELHPDIVITMGRKVGADEEKLKSTGITLVGLDITSPYFVKSDVLKLGYILGQKDRANEYIEWREKYEDKIKDHIANLSVEEKPKVFIEWGTTKKMTFGEGSVGDDLCIISGGENIAHDLSNPWPEVDPEWVIEQDPDIILSSVSLDDQWGWNSTNEPQDITNEIINRPGMSDISAVKNGRGYAVNHNIAWGADSMFGQACWAKCFYPDLDIDPSEIYREYLERYMGIAYPENIVFVYPKPDS